MSDLSFEAALDARVDEMVDACTRCGKCVEACPSVKPAGLADAMPKDVISGILDILRDGDGPEASQRWAQACTASGDCIRACDEGVNPRFLLAMARVSMAKAKNDLPARRRKALERYRDVGREVSFLSQIQLNDEVLARLGQKSASVNTTTEPPDFVFYTGCNVLKTPHIALLALDIMDTLGIGYQVMGGPSHCCGIVHMRPGDVEMSGRMGTNSIDKMSQSKSGQVISWCPSCYVQFTETTLPALERQRGARPFEMTPFLRFLEQRIDQLTPHLRERVPMRVALHRHPGVSGVMEAAIRLLNAIPGVTFVDLKQPALGLQAVYLNVLPEYKRELTLNELQAACDAGVDALVTVYHSEHRELCAHERDWPFRIVNLLELVGESMGLKQNDRYKELKLMQDADQIVADCADLLASHALDAAKARELVVKDMLADQPLPLRSG
ncbi:(Fe-S)-binding protein [Bradyrhizobium sp.]|uniref:(Fe-S)-binding protein n=1 Tax=Bradyrhizobium sp. TaxID=376 RepID=UPI002D571656|nr:(Fe-S)-binding protein [Bradyrhizobium sp.]HZR75592.1 (Fe-S)-binding protein [Bradyrhizobium sp.]